MCYMNGGCSCRFGFKKCRLKMLDVGNEPRDVSSHQVIHPLSLGRFDIQRANLEECQCTSLPPLLAIAIATRLAERIFR